MLANTTTAERRTQNAQAIEALYATGHRLHEQGRYADALIVLRTMILLVPRDERGWVAMGDCHERLGRSRDALDMYALGCIAAAPAPRCELARARALRALDRGEEASHALERALAAAERIDDENIAALVRREQQRSTS